MPIFLNKAQRDWKTKAIRRQRATGFKYSVRYTVSSQYLKRFAHNYMSLLKIEGISIISVVEAMRKRQYIRFTRQFFYECLNGRNNTCYLDVLCNLCDIIGKDLVYVLSLDYDYNEYKRIRGIG